MNASGSIAYPPDADRLTIACALAGVLAEHGVQQVTLTDPRFCHTTKLTARESNLPRVIVDAVPGSTFTADGVALLIDEQHIRYVATGPIAHALSSITPA